MPPGGSIDPSVLSNGQHSHDELHDFVTMASDAMLICRRPAGGALRPVRSCPLPGWAHIG